MAVALNLDSVAAKIVKTPDSPGFSMGKWV